MHQMIFYIQIEITFFFFYKLAQTLKWKLVMKKRKYGWKYKW